MKKFVCVDAGRKGKKPCENCNAIIEVDGNRFRVKGLYYGMPQIPSCPAFELSKLDEFVKEGKLKEV